jgi:hypothetical protein
LENYLVLWTGYLESENAMLQRRSNILVEADKAAKALAKAKPNKVAVAKMLKDDRDQELESCSKFANLEVRRFHQQRLSEMKETLVQVHSTSQSMKQISPPHPNPVFITLKNVSIGHYTL